MGKENNVMILEKVPEASFEVTDHTEHNQIGSDAFRLEYDQKVIEQSLRDDIKSYLREYRLEVQTHPYELIYSREDTGEWRVRDTYGGESMINKGRRAIQERSKEGKPVSIEIAEVQGMQRLDEDILPQPFVWCSPPGPKDQGYGDYGFVYIGLPEKKSDAEILLHMQAIRVENPSMEQYSRALSQFTGKTISYSSNPEFRAHPEPMADLSSMDIGLILKDSFNFQVNTQREQQYDAIIDVMNPYIEQFISLIKTGVSKQEIKSAFYALENYALTLKTQAQALINAKESGIVVMDPRFFNAQPTDLFGLTQTYGYEPPIALGSCGSTKSNDIFGFESAFRTISNLIEKLFNRDQDEETDYMNDPELCRCGNDKPHFHCPGIMKNEFGEPMVNDYGEIMKCSNKIHVGQGITECMQCGLKKTC